MQNSGKLESRTSHSFGWPVSEPLGGAYQTLFPFQSADSWARVLTLGVVSSHSRSVA